jgi:hypothetical protein
LFSGTEKIFPRVFTVNNTSPRTCVSWRFYEKADYKQLESVV